MQSILIIEIYLGLRKKNTKVSTAASTITLGLRLFKTGIMHTEDSKVTAIKFWIYCSDDGHFSVMKIFSLHIFKVEKNGHQCQLPMLRKKKKRHKGATFWKEESISNSSCKVIFNSIHRISEF